MFSKIPIILVTVIGLCFSNMFVSAQSSFVLSGKVVDYKLGALLYCNGQQLKIQSDGSFWGRITTRRSHAGYVEFYSGTDHITLYAEPDDSLHLTFDQSAFWKTLEFGGKYPDHNKFEQIFALRFQPVLTNMVLDSLMPPEVFVRYADKLLETQLKAWEEFAATHTLSPTYQTFREAEIKYRVAYEKMAKPLRFGAAKHLQGYRPKDNYYDFLDDLTIQNNSAIPSKSYQDFLDAYLKYRSGEHLANLTAGRAQAALQYYDQAQQELKDLPLQYALANALIRLFNERLYDERSLSRLQTFKSNNPEIKLVEDVEKAYENNKRLLAGMPAPALSMPDIRGAGRSLEEFKGKVIYLTFWSVTSEESLIALDSAFHIFRREFPGAPLVMYNVNLDDSERDWKLAIRHHEIQGMNVRNNTNKEPDAYAQYNIQAKPSFFLIDQTGKLVMSVTPEPTSLVLLAKLRELLPKEEKDDPSKN
jgi:hypothetical protein